MIALVLVLMPYNIMCQAFIQRAGPEILVRDLPPKREVVLGLKPTEVQVKLLQSLLELLPNRNIFRDKEVRPPGARQHGSYSRTVASRVGWGVTCPYLMRPNAVGWCVSA